jgi:hypothetical protein
MKRTSIVLILLGFTLLLYGFYNCGVERFEVTPTANPNITQLKSKLDSVSSIMKNNKYILERTNQIKEDLKKKIAESK